MDMVTYAALSKQIRESGGATQGTNAPICIDIDTAGLLSEKHEACVNYSELFNILKENPAGVFVRVFGDTEDGSLPMYILPFIGFSIEENDASEESPALKFGLVYRKEDIETWWYFNAYLSPQQEVDGTWYSTFANTRFGHLEW